MERTLGFFQPPLFLRNQSPPFRLYLTPLLAKTCQGGEKEEIDDLVFPKVFFWAQNVQSFYHATEKGKTSTEKVSSEILLMTAVGNGQCILQTLRQLPDAI